MRYLRDRIISFAATLLLISAVTFFAVNVLPGDPALLILGTEGDPERLASLRQELGLNQPVLIRFAGWLTGMLRGDLGRSIRYSVDIAPLIKNALPVTLLLAVSGVGLALLISIPIGIGCAVRHGSLFETLSLVMTQFGMALPSFWLGLLLINLFALRLGILPPAGYTSGASLILPALALALPRAAVLIRVVRGSVLDALNQDYIRTARSKGLPQYGPLQACLKKRGGQYCRSIRRAADSAFRWNDRDRAGFWAAGPRPALVGGGTHERFAVGSGVGGNVCCADPGGQFWA